jgi:septal ring factor EnvC (AmiA/AmiB activator)
VAVAKRSLDALLNPSTTTAIPANSVSKQEVDKLIKQAEEKLRQEASNRSNLEKELEKAKIEAERLKNSQTNSASTKKLFVSPSF